MKLSLKSAPHLGAKIVAEPGQEPGCVLPTQPAFTIPDATWNWRMFPLCVS